MGFDNVKPLSGLFYVGSKKDENCGYLETVLSWNHFWTDGTDLQQPSFTPFSHNNNVFDYLEMFELTDTSFITRCQNNCMDLKLWAKKGSSLNEVLNIPVKLHPFYEAFSNPNSINQFYKEPMPIVSFTDWMDINAGCSVTDKILSAKIQILLAIGTTEQLDNLKRRHSILPMSLASNTNDNSTPDPVFNQKNIEIASNIRKTLNAPKQTLFADLIDNLMLSLPKRTEPSPTENPDNSRPQLRRTSDLLDVLQNALSGPMPANLMSSPLSTMLNRKICDSVAAKKSIKPVVRLLVNIESACNVTLQKNNKKSCENDTSTSGTGYDVDNDPSTYVVFEAAECIRPEKIVKFSTKIVENNSNPQWNERFDVVIPSTLLCETEKNFVFKLCCKRKTGDDDVIGSCNISLASLTSGHNIAGRHNIVDSFGHVNGQIMINITIIHETNIPLSKCIEELENESNDVDNVVLSRTLKRKFTELEEISQRLKSRLLDVTSEDFQDVDDEFENDLNTCPEEDENDCNQSFDWNRFSALEINCALTDGNDESEENSANVHNDISKVVNVLQVSEVEEKVDAANISCD